MPPVSDKGDGKGNLMRMLLQIRQHAKRFWADDRGQSTTEYILILAIVVMVAMKFKGIFLKQVGTALNTLDSEMNGALQQDANSSGP